MSLLLSPLLLLMLSLPAIAYGGAQRRRGFAWSGGIAASIALALMTPWVANGLVAAVETHAGDGRPCTGADAIVLLSGGLQREPVDVADHAALNPDAVARAFGLLRAQAPDAPLLIAGGGPHPIAEADVLDDLLRRLGRAAAWRETRSQTTWDNAFEARRVLPAERRRIALATSALHMPRARMVFTAAGFDVCPLIVGRRYLEPKLPWSLVPQTSGLLKSEAALHELAGLAYYRVRLGMM